MHDFEKLGAFYLGRRIDPDSGKSADEPVLYDSRDLTTHAVIIGMTGSGKTGLGIGLLEEAALDHVPVIAIDPKGDLGNLMLTFPELGADDFRPWINERAALDAGQTPAQYAAAQAALWSKGLADWGQDGARIRKLKESSEVAIYTPGSEAGLPISVLKSFAAPTEALKADGDLYRERVQATATGILSLIDLDADPLTSREHILLALILDHHWQAGRGLDLPSLIGAIQSPPVSRVGVMDLESFFPSKDRFALAMRLNNLLAAPGFEAWLRGEALNVHNLLYSPAGKPRTSVLSIAHLDEASRMFFVTMLLNELIAWMRAQQGTSSLRAILYMDEIFGYMPPVANPPSKQLLLTLLKQARAYGLGLVLATQNPVDLDYKGLSNTGTWFIGRLQTERDKARVMEGLEGASQGGGFDRGAMERVLAGLGKRRFLLHNEHEDEDVIFGTRWVMSYLAGPMTRDQISQLMAGHEPAPAATDTAAAAAPPPAATAATKVAPALPPSVRQFFVPAAGSGNIVYYPRLIGASKLAWISSRYDVDESRDFVHTLEVDDGAVSVDWDQAEELPVGADRLGQQGFDDAAFAECPAALAVAGNYGKWEKDYKRWLRQEQTLTLYRHRKFRMTSEAFESEGEFRARLQQRASEERDKAIAALRKRYATKTTTLENRLLRARQAVERESDQAGRKKLDTALSFGTAILGAVLGRKRLSASTASRVGTAIRSASGARKEAGDVERARQTVAKVEADLAALNETLQGEIDALDTAFDAQAEELEDVSVRPKTTDIAVTLFGLAWLPYAESGDGRLHPAWQET